LGYSYLRRKRRSGYQKENCDGNGCGSGSSDNYGDYFGNVGNFVVDDENCVQKK
jgi:hypothetical protein